MKITYCVDLLRFLISRFSPLIQQSNDEAKTGREFVLMAGFPPADLIANLDDTIDDVKLSGQAIAMRWK